MSDSSGTPQTERKPILVADPGRAARERIEELTAAFREVLERGHFILGRHVDVFEDAFTQWQGCSHTIGVANGTDALELCLRACGIKTGDLVIVPTHTAVATATAVVRAGAEPLLLDVDPDSFNLNLNQLKQVLVQPDLSSRIKAVVPVHLYGNPCDMTTIMSLARSRGIIVIEDCSQAHGAKWQGKNVGCFGDAAALSCYPTKNLGALGDAGLCVTNSAAIAEKIRFLRQYGWRNRYISDEVGMNSRLDELQAALLSVQLRYLDEDLSQRKRIADRYFRELSNLPVQLPVVPPSALHTFHQFTVLTEAVHREPLRRHLQRSGIGAAVLYPAPIHLQPAYARFSAQYDLDLSQSEAICDRLLCLPIHPFLSDDEATHVIESIRSYIW
jgi:dTDP-4-amino-4,6-dideoxygalactose transaminase